MKTRNQLSSENRDQKTVFIVEDDQDLLEFYTLILNNEGWSILGTIDNGEVAQLEYKKLNEKPDVIILDIRLPGCSGLDVAKKILEINPNQAILFISGHIDHLLNDPVLKKFSSLRKPFTSSSLIQKLNHLIVEINNRLSRLFPSF
ncbi:MAG: response regulator [Promethearchaeota archaeon]